MNKVKRSRGKFLKTLKDLREGKINLDKVPIPGISGELKGSSESEKMICPNCSRKMQYKFVEEFGAFTYVCFKCNIALTPSPVRPRDFGFKAKKWEDSGEWWEWRITDYGAALKDFKRR